MLVHSQIHLHYMCKIYSQSVQPFDHTFPVFWIVDPIKPITMPPWGIVGRIVWAYVLSQMNPQTCTTFGANRSSRLTASQDFWMCDPLTPLDMPPGILRGDLYLAYAHFQMNPQTWTKVGANLSSRLTASPDVWMFDPLKPPKCPLVSLRAICLAYIHSQMNLHMCTKCDANRTSRLTSSLDFWMCDPLTPNPPPPMSRGELYLAYVHYQTNLQMCTKFGANRSSRLTASQYFWICDPPKAPRNAYLCLEVQLVWHISIPRWVCTCVPNLVSIGPALW